jgi:hypothetical protein
MNPSSGYELFVDVATCSGHLKRNLETNDVDVAETLVTTRTLVESMKASTEALDAAVHASNSLADFTRNSINTINSMVRLSNSIVESNNHPLANSAFLVSKVLDESTRDLIISTNYAILATYYLTESSNSSTIAFNYLNTMNLPSNHTVVHTQKNRGHKRHKTHTTV